MVLGLCFENDKDYDYDPESNSIALPRFEPVIMPPTKMIRLLILLELIVLNLLIIVNTICLWNYLTLNMFVLVGINFIELVVTWIYYIRCYDIVRVNSTSIKQIGLYQKLFTPYFNLLHPSWWTTSMILLKNQSLIAMGYILTMEIRNNCIINMVPTYLLSDQCKPDIQVVIKETFPNEVELNNVSLQCFYILIGIISLHRVLHFIRAQMIIKNVQVVLSRVEYRNGHIGQIVDTSLVPLGPRKPIKRRNAIYGSPKTKYLANLASEEYLKTISTNKHSPITTLPPGAIRVITNFNLTSKNILSFREELKNNTIEKNKK